MFTGLPCCLPQTDSQYFTTTFQPGGGGGGGCLIGDNKSNDIIIYTVFSPLANYS